MRPSAKIYVALVIGAGLALLAVTLPTAWQFPHLPAYLCFLALAILAGALKVRLPGVTGTMSVSFVFILISVVDFTRSQTMIMAALAALVQSMWRPKTRPKPVQVLFNVATLAISAALADLASRVVLVSMGRGSLVVLLSMAATVFFLTNSILVAKILSLLQSKPLRGIWQHCYLWSFPYYLVGAALAGIVLAVSAAAGWQISLLLMPLMYLVYTFYRLYVQRQGPQAVRPV